MKTIRALETLLLSFPKVSERIVPGNSGTVVPLAVIYNSFFTSLVSIILKNICILHQDEEQALNRHLSMVLLFSFVLLKL